MYYTGNEQEWDIIYTGEKGIGTYIDGGNDCLKNAETHYNYIYRTETEQNNNITVILDGRQIKFDVPPQLINDRTMVPMRAIFEAIGAAIEWNEDTNTVMAYKDDKTISLTIGETNMYVNDKTVELDSPACIVNDRTLVPVRAISESLDLAVNWIGETNMVEIKTPQ